MVDDIIYIPDRIIPKNPHSLTDALGKIPKVRENRQDYNIVMLYRTQLKCYFSDIVIASATKSGSYVELINPFQLIKWRDKTSPDHLYPQFKLFLEDFKKGIFTDIPRITYEGPDDPDIQIIPEQDNQDKETGEQKLQAANHKELPTGIDMVLQKLMDPTMIPDTLNVPESLEN